MTNHQRLAGKIALITAAAQGIGLATVDAYAREGATVYAADINAQALEMLKQKNLPNVHTLQLDVTNAEAVTQAVQSLPPLDILFNCAGFVHAGSILECEEKDWDFSFNLNAKAMYRLCKLILPSMLERGKGSIINMSSVASSIKGVPNRFVYCSSKAAVIGLTKAIAADFVTKGIRCNAICPGTVDSPSLHERLRATGDYEAAMKAFIARQPMGRVGDANEIAALAVYLGSDESSFTTGQVHIIDGGWAN
ncbi:SDR family oxidoreductase [Thiolinea disciformis]|uniref:SDR family oxidoreductase n=1 Tax=Thiolinea disciformis TaxID=125614 RepID=UPI00037616F1|nr:SDR family oxidoreductase [Thiolinea disciformis]